MWLRAASVAFTRRGASAIVLTRRRSSGEAVGRRAVATRDFGAPIEGDAFPSSRPNRIRSSGMLGSRAGLVADAPAERECEPPHEAPHNRATPGTLTCYHDSTAALLVGLRVVATTQPERSHRETATSWPDSTTALDG